MFGIFNLFWTAVPLMLTRTLPLRSARDRVVRTRRRRRRTRRADRRTHRRPRLDLARGTFGAMLTIVSRLLLPAGPLRRASMFVLVIAAIALDAAMQGNQIIGQRLIYTIDPEARGRINAIYMTSVFVCRRARLAARGPHIFLRRLDAHGRDRRGPRRRPRSSIAASEPAHIPEMRRLAGFQVGFSTYSRYPLKMSGLCTAVLKSFPRARG